MQCSPGVHVCPSLSGRSHLFTSPKAEAEEKTCPPQGAGRIALFPDTVSDRAQRHVRELTALARAGGRAVLAFVVQRGDCCAFAPCHEKDPKYGRLVLEAAEAGVGLVAVACALDEGKGVVRLQGQLPVRLDYKLPA